MASMEKLYKDDAQEDIYETGSKAAKVASFILFGKLVSFFLMAVAFIIIVRILGPSVYGVYTLAIAVAGFFGSVGNFGIGTSLNKFIAEYKHKKDYENVNLYIVNGLSILFIAGVALAAVTVLFSSYLAMLVFHNPADSFIVDIAAISILTTMLYGGTSSALVGYGNGKHVSVSILSMAIVQASVGISLALAGFGALAPLIGLILGSTTAFIVALLYMYLVEGAKLRKPAFSFMKKLLKFSMPITISNFFSTVVNNLALIVLGIFTTTVILGNFGVASRLGSLIDIITGSISLSLLTAFSSSFAGSQGSKEIGRIYSNSVYFSFILVAPLLISVVVLARPFSFTAFSSVYSFAPMYIRILGIGMVIGLFSAYAGAALIGASKVKTMMKYNILISVIQLALIPLLIPTLKGFGTVLLLFLITPILSDIFFVRLMVKYFDLKLRVKRLLLAVAANAIAAGILYMLLIFLGWNYELLIVVAFFVMLVAYPALLGLLGGIGKEEVNIIEKMSTGIPVIGRFIRVLAVYSSKFMQ
ncbi:MAG: oligosaccharide flippase family protein [Candidatus Micrarchaeia archaeon]